MASVPAILHPLPNVAVHVVQAEGVRRERANLDSLTIVPRAAAAVAVRSACPDSVPPMVFGFRALPRPTLRRRLGPRLLPLSLRQPDLRRIQEFQCCLIVFGNYMDKSAKPA